MRGDLRGEAQAALWDVTSDRKLLKEWGTMSRVEAPLDPSPGVSSSCLLPQGTGLLTCAWWSSLYWAHPQLHGTPDSPSLTPANPFFLKSSFKLSAFESLIWKLAAKDSTPRGFSNLLLLLQILSHTQRPGTLCSVLPLPRRPREPRQPQPHFCLPARSGEHRFPFRTLLSYSRLVVSWIG